MERKSTPHLPPHLRSHFTTLTVSNMPLCMHPRLATSQSASTSRLPAREARGSPCHRIPLCQMSHLQKGFTPPPLLFQPSLLSPAPASFTLSLHHSPPPPSPSSPSPSTAPPTPTFLPLIRFYPLFHSLELSVTQTHTLTLVCSSQHFAELSPLQLGAFSG